MKYLWLGLCLLPLAGIGKNNPTAECRWLYDRIAALEQAIKKALSQFRVERLILK